MLFAGNQNVYLNPNFFHYMAFPNLTKYCGQKIGIHFSNTPLVVEQNNYASKIVNACIFYDLDDWSKIPLNKFKLKNYLFGAANIAKNSDKSKSVDGCYEIAFDGAGLWSLVTNLIGMLQFLVLIIVHHLILIIAKIIFQCQNIFLVLGVGPTDDANGSIGAEKKRFIVLILVKQRQNFA